MGMVHPYGRVAFSGLGTGRSAPVDRMANIVTRLPTDPIGQVQLTILGLQPGSDIVFLNAGTDVEILNVDAAPGTEFAHTFFRYDAPTIIDLAIYKVGYVPYTLVRGFTLPATDAVLPVRQLVDRNYLNP